ncbi:GNAT family N-acetyltransferase [Flavobacterium frigoris]|uniref:GCN5-related N-acetyltransferase n=1 Tax=Flavobacterium frigoris (strain PS1) TaxID=1086011 RepID=H7FU82_FLAFP|nr:GNAT family N-acetyltransferase [Flavobacterium frigoris]EIA08006.1 GCN5-related N-acetyltransferase [Flavobacterium frigoris PS1]
MITVSIASANDYKIIQEIAYQTWPETYGAILSKEQLEFMLDAFYSVSALNDNVVSKGHHFLLAKEDDVVLGFASYEHNYQRNNRTRIHKIYVLPKTQGKGIGNTLISHIEKLGIENKSTALSLNVNRFNSAYTFYQKKGFVVIEEVNIEIGHGYLMEDYVMEKQL